MADALILTTQILGVIALAGAILGVWQLIQIRLTLGPLWQGDLGVIIAEHILGGAVWLTLLFGYYLVTIVGRLPPEAHGWIQFWLLATITAVVWGFCLRVHLWYRRKE